MSKKEGNFINFGTYSAQEADMLIEKFKNKGITAKKEYPGTSVGTDSSGEAAFSAYTLLIKNEDRKKAREIREEVNVNPIGKGEKMPLPESFNWTILARIELAGIFLLFLGLLLQSLGVLEGQLGSWIVGGFVTLITVSSLYTVIKMMIRLFGKK